MSMKVTKKQFVGKPYEKLLAENAELRELCEDMLDFICEDCHSYACDPEGFVECTFQVRMRELGIEVG